MLINYFLYSTCVDLQYSNGQLIRVYFSNRTGLIIKRPKRHLVLKHFIDHKGMVLGNLYNGVEIVLHNHLDAKTAIVTNINDFEQGIKSTTDNKICSNDLGTQIQIALNDVLIKRPYDALEYNCQTYVNRACSNSNASDDAGRVFVGALTTIAVIGILGAIFK